MTVTWKPLSPSSVRGVLKGYFVRTRLLSTNLRQVHDAKVEELTLGNDETSLKLTSLKPFSEYEIEVAAKSGVGVGASRKLIGSKITVLFAIDGCWL